MIRVASKSTFTN